MAFVQKHFAASAIGLAVLSALPDGAKAASLGLDFSADAPNMTWNNDGGYTFGYAFKVLQQTYLLGLGSWNSGITDQVRIGLWNSAGHLIAEAAVTGDEEPQGQATWVFASVDPVRLSRGLTYYVGSSGRSGFAYDINGITTAPEIQFLHDAQSIDGFAFPNQRSAPEDVGIGFFGGNVLVGDLNIVPEPASMAILGAGLVGLGLARRRRRAA